MVKKDNTLKKEVGKRFRSFRDSIKKTQRQLSEELNIYQSTIANIESGKIFPRIKFLHYCNREYKLDFNWLFSGEGNMFAPESRNRGGGRLDCHVAVDDPIYERYTELMNYMRVPEVEQVIWARLIELKALYSDKVKAFDKSREKSS
ncbi:MAG: helix-turn-helix domain-containing protein [bacterium]|nr:helix-turn-helix domain-containing protein [bacterium]